MRKPIIAGNWKMHKNMSEAKALAEGIVQKVQKVEKVQIVLCPPFTALGVVAEAIKGSNVELGAQNCHFEDKGAFSGEISTAFLIDAGCKFVIIGHSERRQYFVEDDALINKKIKKALSSGLIPIFCIGETLQERQKEQTFDVLKRQVLHGLQEVNLSDPERLIVAYEPVWAIGTGMTASKEQAQEAHRYIRDLLAGLWGSETAEKIRIQYGGSVKPDNVTELMAQDDIDGALVGGASLEADSFSRIIKF
ncbi:MAG: triose-phosphate isomerase [Candidatus Edwardsbacteria bacterium RIFOXYD12_FULL_50_11]|uniref:Triosephosphate isomerase n=1 Tax=Candidatus Edwardsbacteria bacterium GWF2_54_11 TaxID=1817851 RepID=A0A1F5RI67_9BACT|nr:MAG: triose-phosphate isomerase [Candidatus Edwardsbacteria bacterium RifOxyC12_full_54_24]OGF06987.1 MAG: triose-phosphate isomerase [Candidatus Edwardsbacteria bacterium RifOxyA12_full_54_48]OGF11047.1 MAG: triose-phosphate isomerase [Candidatus Edwardsbacteria bacterium GWE2_54_12]OGF14054.1 MAG: triose-phosphate isomerase [Candidatus Edwardsbacteria bacterium GWF2_54_11]OGF15993.1 MAG: triose-phosphate isomerase [Candidatus Edwardsbacteria bacterium RIFOXYD12_FULL_50_11]OGJ17542.1 MAG: 